MPTISPESRTIIWIITAIAVTLFAIFSSYLAADLRYLIGRIFLAERRGRPPTRKPRIVWVVYILSTLIMIAGSAIAGTAPTEQPVAETLHYVMIVDASARMEKVFLGGDSKWDIIQQSLLNRFILALPDRANYSLIVLGGDRPESTHSCDPKENRIIVPMGNKEEVIYTIATLGTGGVASLNDALVEAKKILLEIPQNQHKALLLFLGGGDDCATDKWFFLEQFLENNAILLAESRMDIVVFPGEDEIISSINDIQETIDKNDLISKVTVYTPSNISELQINVNQAQNYALETATAISLEKTAQAKLTDTASASTTITATSTEQYPTTTNTSLPPSITSTPTVLLSSMQNPNISPAAGLGEINYTYPLSMQLDTSKIITVDIHALVGYTNFSLNQAFVVTPSRDAESCDKNIGITREMKVTLEKTSAFEITSDDQDKQKVSLQSPQDTTHWQWTVRPLIEGSHYLPLRVYRNNDLTPSWICNLRIFVGSSTVTPSLTPSLTLTTTPTLTLLPTFTPTFTLVPTPTPWHKPVTDNMVENSTTIIIWLIGGFVAVATAVGTAFAKHLRRIDTINEKGEKLDSLKQKLDATILVDELHKIKGEMNKLESDIRKLKGIKWWQAWK